MLTKELVIYIFPGSVGTGVMQESFGSSEYHPRRKKHEEKKMKCPLCDAHTEVKETRHGTARRRQCYNEHTFWTEEKITTEPKPKGKRGRPKGVDPRGT
jgi:hypothetical protein